MNTPREPPAADQPQDTGQTQQRPERPHAPPLPVPLLSRDLQFGARDLQFGAEEGPKGQRGGGVVQPALPGLGVTDRHHRVRVKRVPLPNATDPDMDAYLARLQARGASSKTVGAYRYQLEWIIRVAAHLTGAGIALRDLFTRSALLGKVIVSDTGIRPGQTFSRWTMTQRRSAVRSFASLMRPELLRLLGEDPALVLDRALRANAERVGAGYRVSGGKPRRFGGFVPTAGEVRAVIAVASKQRGATGTRNAAFLTILRQTGCRVKALSSLDGANCLTMPNGRLRLYLREKGRRLAREVELSSEAASALQRYVAELNREAAAAGKGAQVVLGRPGAVWRNSQFRPWSTKGVRQLLAASSRVAGVPRLTPHAFRRAFATEAAAHLPRHVVALAGGWQGVQRLDNHYVKPRRIDLWEKLGRLTKPQSVDHGDFSTTATVPVTV